MSYPLRPSTLARYYFLDGANPPSHPPPLFRLSDPEFTPCTFAAEGVLGIPLSLALLRLCLGDTAVLSVFECLRHCEALKRAEYAKARETVKVQHSESERALGRRLPVWEAEIERLDAIAAWGLRAVREKQVSIIQSMLPQIKEEEVEAVCRVVGRWRGGEGWREVAEGEVVRLEGE